jgi:uncharacterized protein (TIGR04255 family)
MTESLPGLPFGDEPLANFKLRSAPLTNMIVQVRFPRSTELAADQQTILEIARALSEDFPAFSERSEAEFEFGPGGAQMKQSPRWQFTSFSETDTVVITPTSVSLTSNAYTSRDDMIHKLTPVLAATLTHARPAFIERVGVRYTNRVDDAPTSEQLRLLFKEPLLAGLSVPTGSVRVAQAITHTVYQVSDEVSLSIRSGLVPAGLQLDPGHDPAPQDSFLFDLDAFRGQKQQRVDPALILQQVSSLAEVVYRFFLWSLTLEGLEHFGGEQIDDASDI